MCLHRRCWVLLGLVLVFHRGVAAGDLVLARGTGVEVRQSELEAVMQRQKLEWLSLGKVPDEATEAALRSQQLDRLILLQLCQARALPEDQTNSTTAARAFVDQLRREQGESAFRRLLARAGFDESTFLTNKQAEALVSAVVNRELKPSIRVPTADRRRYYDEHPELWAEPESARVAWLPLPVIQPATGEPLSASAVTEQRRLIAELRDRARRGEDFGALVLAHTTDPKLRESRGEQVLRRGEVISEIEGPAFQLPVGAVSEVLEVPGVVAILKVLERTQPQRKRWEEVDEQIHQLLAQRELELRIPEFVQRLRRIAKVELQPVPQAPPQPLSPSP